MWPVLVLSKPGSGVLPNACRLYCISKCWVLGTLNDGSLNALTNWKLHVSDPQLQSASLWLGRENVLHRMCALPIDSW